MATRALGAQLTDCVAVPSRGQLAKLPLEASVDLEAMGRSELPHWT